MANKIYKITSIHGNTDYVHASSDDEARRIASEYYFEIGGPAGDKVRATSETTSSTSGLVGGRVLTSGGGESGTGPRLVGRITNEKPLGDYWKTVTLSPDAFWDNNRTVAPKKLNPLFDPEKDQHLQMSATGEASDAALLRADEDRNRFGSFLEAAAQRFGPNAYEGQFGSTIGRQFNPLARASRLAGVVQGFGNQLTQDDPFTSRQFFRDRLKANPSGFAASEEALRKLFAGEFASGNLNVGGEDVLASDRAAQMLSPDTATDQGEADVQLLLGLGRDALRSQRGSFIGGNLAPSNDRVQARLQQLLATGGFGAQGTTGGRQSVGDFTRQQFGLNF